MTSVFNPAEQTQSLTSILLWLRSLTEPTFLVHVGAGRGVGELHAWHTWGVPKVLMIDADEKRLAWAQQLCAQHSGWKVSVNVIANEGPEVQYHLASNPDEDSLVPMQSLNAIWENIRTVKTQTVSSTSLDRLLTVELGEDARHQTAGMWCLIDCLPADLILLGADDSLAKMSVIVARVVLKELALENSAGQLSKVKPYLQAKGFKCLSVLETTHPSIGYGVFVRDFKMTHEQYVAEAQTELQAEQATIALQREHLSELRLQQDRLEIDRDTQLETVSDLSKTNEALRLELHDLRQQLAEREAMLAETAQGKLALQGRQTHLHDDLVRAEAQIDLIKELLFTSPSLKG